MKRLLMLCFVLAPFYVHALDGIYLGGRVGYVGLSGDASNTFDDAIGYGADLGLRINPLFDLMFQVHRSEHDPNLSITSLTMAADAQLGRFYDFGFTVGGGPGFYFFDSGQSVTKFGLNLGVGGDFWIADQFRVGLEFRYQFVFDRSDFHTTMLRVGYLIEN